MSTSMGDSDGASTKTSSPPCFAKAESLANSTVPKLGLIVQVVFDLVGQGFSVFLI